MTANSANSQHAAKRLLMADKLKMEPVHTVDHLQSDYHVPISRNLEAEASEEEQRDLEDSISAILRRSVQ